MSRHREGGLQAAKTNKERHGEDFYRRVGKLGGQTSTKGGFAANKKLAAKAGSKGGKARWDKWRADKLKKEDENE